jgi:hypothetical protein
MADFLLVDQLVRNCTIKNFTTLTICLGSVMIDCCCFGQAVIVVLSKMNYE